ncbi:MAG: aldo/keto reductase [Pseudomonadota bacterium]
MADSLETNAVNRLVYGCMRIAGDGSPAATARGFSALDAAYELGIRRYDLADIYGAGHAERLFGQWLRQHPSRRDRIVVTTKCGVRLATDASPQHYDLSPQHITASLEGSLSRLGLDRVDFLLLHRPDYLAEPSAINRCFEALAVAERFASIGLSNFNAARTRLLHAELSMPIACNQIEFSLANPNAMSNGTLDTCRELGIAIEAWSPLGGAIQAANDPPAFESLRQALSSLADDYGVSSPDLALAWVLRHPARIAPVIGTLTPTRIETAVAATHLTLERADWYRLLEARRGRPVP